MESFSFRVTPSVLEEKAGEFSDIVSEIETQFGQIEEISARTNGYWRGEAGDKNREGFASYKDDIKAMLARLKEHPMNLLQMAGLYSNVENDALDANQKLDTSGIV